MRLGGEVGAGVQARVGQGDWDPTPGPTKRTAGLDGGIASVRVYLSEVVAGYHHPLIQVAWAANQEAEVPDAQHGETEAAEAGQLWGFCGVAAKARGRMDGRTAGVVAVAVAEGVVGMEVVVGPEMESEDEATGEGRFDDGDHDGVHDYVRGDVRDGVRGDVHGDVREGVRAYVDVCDPLQGHASQPS
jgi:hypothetical protein